MRSFSICRPCLRSFLRQHSQCESTSGRRTRAFHSARATWAKDDENSTSTPENPAAQTNAQLQHDQKKADQEMTDLLRQFSAVYPESKPPATTPNPVKPLDLQHDQKNVEQYPPKEPPTTTTNRAKHSDVREDRNNAERASSISPPNGRATTQNNQKEPEIRYNQKLVEQEMKSLLEKFGLAEIEDKSTDNGVEITSDNRIIIKDPSRAKAKHKTILVLSPAPASLSMRDFRKLIKTGKHMEGWKSGGLEEGMLLMAILFLCSGASARGSSQCQLLTFYSDTRAPSPRHAALERMGPHLLNTLGRLHIPTSRRYAPETGAQIHAHEPDIRDPTASRPLNPRIGGLHDTRLHARYALATREPVRAPAPIPGADPNRHRFAPEDRFLESEDVAGFPRPGVG